MRVLMLIAVIVALGGALLFVVFDAVPELDLKEFVRGGTGQDPSFSTSSIQIWRERFSGPRQPHEGGGPVIQGPTEQPHVIGPSSPPPNY